MRASVLLLLGCLLPPVIACDSLIDPPPPAEEISDVLLRVNSSAFPKPPTRFRSGHVTPRAFDINQARTITKDGYRIQLPAGGQTPTPTIYEDALYVSGGFDSKQYYAFKIASGDLQWALDLDDDGPSTAAASKGVIIINTESCTIFALDARTGRHLWSHWLGDPLLTTPTIANGRVFTAYPAEGVFRRHTPGAKHLGVDPSHVMIALDLRTGRILWQKWIDSDIMSAPVASGDDLYVTTFSGNVYRFAQNDGAIRSVVRTRATSAPVIAGGEVYFTRRADGMGGSAAREEIFRGHKETFEGESYGRKAAPYLDSQVQSRSEYSIAAKEWDAANGFAGGAPTAAKAGVAKDVIGQDSVSSLQAFQGSRMLHYKGLNINTMGDEIRATDAREGDRAWSLKLPGDLSRAGGFLAAPPAAAGGYIFVATLEGDVLQIDPGDGSIHKRYSTGERLRFQPLIHRGSIFVTTQTGELIAIKTGDPTLTGWTTWGGDASRSGVVN